MVSCLPAAVDIEHERAHTGQRTDETNAGHGIGKQPFPLTEDLQQYHGILGGGVFGRRAQRKFNTPAASGADGVGVVVFPEMAVFPRIVVFPQNSFFLRIVVFARNNR